MAAPADLQAFVIELKEQNDKAEAFEKKLTTVNVKMEKIQEKLTNLEEEIAETSRIIEKNENARKESKTLIQKALNSDLMIIKSLRDLRMVMDLHQLGFQGFEIEVDVPFDDWQAEFETLSEVDLEKDMMDLKSHLRFIEGQTSPAPHRGVVDRTLSGLMAERKRRDAIKLKEEEEKAN